MCCFLHVASPGQAKRTHPQASVELPDDDAPHHVSVEKSHDLFDIPSGTIVYVDAKISEALAELRPLQEPRPVPVHSLQVRSENAEPADATARKNLSVELLIVERAGGGGGQRRCALACARVRVRTFVWRCFLVVARDVLVLLPGESLKLSFCRAG